MKLNELSVRLHSYELVWSESLFGLFSQKKHKHWNIGVCVCVWEGLFCSNKSSSHIGPKPPKRFFSQSQMAAMNCGQLNKSSPAPLNVFKCYLSFSFSQVEISHLWPNCHKTVLEHCVWMRGQDKMVWPPKVDTTLLFRRVLPEWNQWRRTLHTA